MSTSSGDSHDLESPGIPGVSKNVPNYLMLYFEAVTTIMLGILDFSVSADLYNSFDTLLLCFHDLMNKWH